MTTDDKTLTEQIARALALENGYDPDHSCDEWAVDAYRGDAAAVLPIIRKAERDAAREALDGATAALVAEEGASPRQIEVLARYRDNHHPEDVTP